MKLSDCPQLVIYLILSSLSIIGSFLATNKYIKINNGNEHIANLYGHIIGVIVISGLLYWLCEHNHHTAAWLLLLLPFIMLVTMLLLLIVAMSRTHKKNHDHPPHGHWR